MTNAGLHFCKGEMEVACGDRRKVKRLGIAAVIAACAICGAATAAEDAVLPTYADSPWLRARTAEIARTAPTELAAARRQLEEIAPEIERAFANAPAAIERERTLKRLEIARDLCGFIAECIAAGDASSLQFAERGLDDLRLLDGYFRDELELWPRNPLNPAVEPVVLNAADYGATGDGATPNGAAFARVFEAVRALGGKPCLVRVPAGIYRFTENFKSARWHLDCQLLMEGLTNVAVVGESPAATHLVWGLYDSRGGVAEHCRNVTIKGFQVYWEKNPFSEGMVLSADPQEGSCVMEASPLAMTPDARSLRSALTSQFDADGHICLDASFAWLDPKRPVEPLGGNRFKLYFNRTSHGESWRKVSAGRTICIPDRNNNYHGFHAIAGAFVTFDSLWFRNSRAAAFSAYLTRHVCATRCRIFPREGCVLSTSADGFYTATGSYLAHSDFSRMHDDGNNSHSGGHYIHARIGADTLVFGASARLPRAGDLMLLVSPLDGRYIGNARIAEDAVRTNWNGKAGLAMARFESLPPDIATFDSLGMAALSKEEQQDIIFGRAKVARMPDHIYLPGPGGVASVVTDCRLASLRNVAIPVQAPLELVESNVVENVATGIHLCGLVQWMEGPPPYRTVVRGNVFRGCGTAIRSTFIMPNHGCAVVAPMRGCRIEGNRIEDSVGAAMDLKNLGHSKITGNTVIGGATSISAYRCEALEFK